jgi:hypothetical protein
MADGSGRRRPCGDGGRRGEATALGGAANGCGKQRWRLARQPGVAAGEVAWQTEDAATTMSGGGQPAACGRLGGGGGRAGGYRRRAGGRQPAVAARSRKKKEK